MADSYVDASHATSNYGTRTTLKTDVSPTKNAYLRFDVQGVGSTTSARLRVFASSNNSAGFQVHSVTGTDANTWGETTVNFNNAPELGPVVGSSGAVQSGRWYNIDVSSLVSGDGPVSFALTSPSSTSTSYSSREGSNPAQLLVPAPEPASGYLVSRDGTTYHADPQGAGPAFTGTLKQVVESAVLELKSGGGGTITFTSGIFDLGSSYFELKDVSNITFQGQGMDATTIQNNSSASADTEPFNTSTTHNVVIRDMTVNAYGPGRSTSDAIDMDGGNNDLIERVKINVSRARGIVFDGKDIVGGQPRTADGNTIRDCVIDGVTSYGIQFLAARNNTVQGCTITNTGSYGIQMSKSSTVADQPNKKASGNLITGNVINQAGTDGINIVSSDGNQITGNTVLNSSDNVTSRDGVRISSSDSVTCDDNVVTNNTLADDQAVHTQRYGLYISSSLCNRTVVGGNTFYGNLSGDIRNSGTGTIFQ